MFFFPLYADKKISKMKLDLLTDLDEKSQSMDVSHT